MKKTPKGKQLYCITVLVVAHKEPQGMVAEKDVGDVITYCKNDIEHYIMTNSGILVSSWFTENLESIWDRPIV